MASPGTDLCTIRRIRLVNFHNFVDETIEIRNGGHLFILGDNASGKTTLLDAVHYVLTAGESMEFNSAARIAGSREEGRRIQGVILRYNVDTGPLNPDGGVTYAALEIAGRRGIPTTIGIGMRAGGMDEKVHRWGILRECPLESIPFLVDTPEGRRPASRDEMRDAFGAASGFFSNIGAYQREVAARFFGGMETFRDVCRLLRIGKSYREIVAHAEDYHVLFRSLLPEPRTEMFEQVIAALRSLDQANADLAALEAKHAYVNALRDLVQGIEASRGDRNCLAWLLHEVTARDLDRRCAELGEERRRREVSVSTLQGRVADLRRAQEEAGMQLQDLRLRDTTGTIRQEKELAAEYERLLGREADARERQAEASARLAEARHALESDREALRGALAAAAGAVRRQAPELPFEAAGLAEALEAARDSAVPEDGLAQVPLEPLRERVLEALRAPEGELALWQHRRAEAGERLAGLEARLRALQSQTERVPGVPGFAEALAALRRGMVSATPLYTALEWVPGLSPALASAVEEAIGEEVLATLMVPPEDFAAARAIVFPIAPGLRLAAAPAYGDLADWMHTVFDLPRCDAAALRCLAEEMLAHNEPEVQPAGEGQALRFRAHERRLHGKPASLIGQESRRAALRRDIDAAHAELAAAREELAEADRKCREAGVLLERCREFRRLLDGEAALCVRRAGEVHRARAALGVLEAAVQHAEAELDSLARERGYLEERLGELRALIRQEGLDQLEAQIARAARRLESLRNEETAQHVQLGSLDNQIKGITQTLTRLQQEAQAAREHRAAEERTLLARFPEARDPAGFVAERCPPERFPDAAAAAAAIEECRRQEANLAGQLQNALLHPVYSAAFGFAYDAVSNLLTDHRGQTVTELAEAHARWIGEQREVISQKTQDLFRRLIVEQLLGFLSKYVRDLRAMVHRANRLLGERVFGGCRYFFQIREVERYRRLVEIVEHYNPFQAEQATEEIRAFFEEYKAEILETEVNAVPDALDYRNWFHYDMRVSTADRDGIVMDRHTKSVGSGGEQAVPNYLLILTIADFLYHGSKARLQTLLFDEAFYGIDAGRRDQILGFANDIGLQLIVASPDQDGVRSEVAWSTSLLIVKDEDYDVHLFPYHWENPDAVRQPELLEEYRPRPRPLAFEEEL